MGLIKNYPDGSDITLLNNFYQYPKKQEDGKWSKDCMTIIYRDNITGEKKKEEIENPDYDFYLAKPDVNIENNELFLEKDKLELVKCKYKDLTKTIAEKTNNMNFYNENIKSGNRYANNKLHMHPRVFMSDSNIEDHYRFLFSNQYKDESYKLKKTFFDIEADTIKMKGDFPEMGECPVNAVTIINNSDFENKAYTLLLRNSENPLIEEFEKSLSPETFAELRELIKYAVGGEKKMKKYNLDTLEFEFMFYDDEIQLISDLFKFFNYKKPDFILAWNMAFDIPYLIERIKVLGYKPEDIMCHPDFKHKVATYYVDERNINLYEERGDFAKIASYSVYICQMIQFASRRKNGPIKRYKLDYIGNIVAGARKLDYSHITTNIAELPWKDYKTFVFYNIIDTIVQRCIEQMTGDLDYTFNKCLINNTRYSKCHRQTVYLVNRGKKEFYKDDFIIGNNANRGNSKPETKFPGAFVANPLKISDEIKTKINGKPCNMFRNSDDFDYKSLYPSQMREFNMAPNTQIGRIYINNKPNKEENPYKSEYYHRSGAYLEDLHSWNFIEFCHRWLNFGNYLELYKDIQEYFTLIKPSMKINTVTMDGLYYPIMHNDFNKTLYCPISVLEKDELQCPIVRYNGRPDYSLKDKINISEVVYRERNV